MFTDEEIDYMFRPKLVVPSIPDLPEVVCIPDPEPLTVPSLRPKNKPKKLAIERPRRKHALSVEQRRERNRYHAALHRARQEARLRELKVLLYGDENAILPFDLERITLPPALPRQERAIIYSGITRKRRKTILAFLEAELALKCRA